jgi:hypothetical protein
LRLGIAPAHFHRGQFVAANAARQNFSASGCGIELPFSIAPNHGYGKRPFIPAHRERHLVWHEGISFQFQLFMSRTSEFRAKIFVLRGVAGLHDIFAGGPKDAQQSGRVIVLGRIDGRLNGFFGSCEGPLGRSQRQRRKGQQ